jgi:hypothetical protein
MATNGVTWRSWFRFWFRKAKSWFRNPKSWVRNPKLVVEAAQIIVALIVLAIHGKPLSWPLIVLATFIAFFSQIRVLLEGLTTLISKSAGIEIVIAGQKIKLNFAEASDFLQKMADDIKILIDGLTKEQKDLFLFIAKDPGAQGEIGEPPLRFERKNPPTILHKDLRALRERHLLRPKGGGTWREHKSPELTPFGKLVATTPSFEGKSIERERMEDYLERARSQ